MANSKNIYAVFSLAQLGEAYAYHSQQDCPISQRMAKEIMREIIDRKGQRAAKIRQCCKVDTESDVEGLWIYEAGDEDSEPMAYISKTTKEVNWIWGEEWQQELIEALA